VDADIVVSSTSSPGYVVTQELVKAVRKARKGRSLFLIDIAVPRDVDPAVHKLENVYLYDVDDLSKHVHDSLEGRASEARLAEAITAAEARGFETWTQEQALTPAIVGLRSRTRAVLEAELARSLGGRLRHLPSADREALSVMLDAATNKLLHGPVTRLRALAGDPRAEDYVATLRDLFEVRLEPATEADPAESPRASGRSRDRSPVFPRARAELPSGPEAADDSDPDALPSLAGGGVSAYDPT
jgi:glutamyl-tRNA reductase